MNMQERLEILERFVDMRELEEELLDHMEEYENKDDRSVQQLINDCLHDIKLNNSM